jgi:hypothetical protein
VTRQRPLLHRSPGFAEQSRSGRGLHRESKLSWRPTEMVASPFVAALHCARNSPTGRVRGEHRGMLLMNLVFKRTDSAYPCWSPGRHRDRQLCRPGARLYMLRTAPRRTPAALIRRGPPSQDASFLVCEGRDDQLERPRFDAANRGWLGHIRQCRRGHWQGPVRP